MARAASTRPVADKDKPKRADLRVLQSNERTLLSWLRTGLAGLGFGFIAARIGVLTQSSEGGDAPNGAMWVGLALIVLASAGMAAGAVRYVRARRAILTGRPIAPDSMAALSLAVGLVLIGAVLAVYILVS